MKTTILSVTIILASFTLFAQHQHDNNPISFQSVLTQQFSDPELKEYRIESSLMTLAPGMIDTVSHRHDCELFGYIQKGSVQIGLEKRKPLTFSRGQMFYEKRNILHSLLKNSSSNELAEVLLIFIIKHGRQGYIAEYDKK